MSEEKQLYRLKKLSKLDAFKENKLEGSTFYKDDLFYHMVDEEWENHPARDEVCNEVGFIFYEDEGYPKFKKL
jgi:hypothetical protein